MQSPSVHWEAIWERYHGILEASTLSLDAAFRCGASADRLGVAFAVGYQAALHSLLQGAGVAALEKHLFSFCSSERRGNTPGVMTTTLTKTASGGFRLNGHKSFVTGASFADRLLVVAVVSEPTARTGGKDHSHSKRRRQKLAVVVVRSDAPGVEVTTHNRSLPFIPEVPHGAVAFSDVHIQAHNVLPGDGFQYYKSFRTIEVKTISFLCMRV